MSGISFHPAQKPHTLASAPTVTGSVVLMRRFRIFLGQCMIIRTPIFWGIPSGLLDILQLFSVHLQTYDFKKVSCSPNKWTILHD